MCVQDWRRKWLKKWKNERKTSGPTKRVLSKFFALRERWDSPQENGSSAIHQPTRKRTRSANSLEFQLGSTIMSVTVETNGDAQASWPAPRVLLPVRQQREPLQQRARMWYICLTWLGETRFFFSSCHAIFIALNLRFLFFEEPTCHVTQ